MLWLMAIISAGLEKPPVVVLTMPTGDPTVFGNLPVDKAMKEAVKKALDSDTCNGYGPAQGRSLK